MKNSLTFSSVILIFFAAGCSDNPAEDMQALGEEYGIDLSTGSQQQTGIGDTDEIDRDQADMLFQYISSSLEEGSPYEGDVPIESELTEPAEPYNAGGTHLAQNADYAEEDDEFAAFSRNVSFDYQLQEDTETITPDTIYIEDMEAELSGTLPGASWDDYFVSADFDADTGEFIFFTEGVWNIHFEYEGEEMYAAIPDTWFVHFDPDEILDSLPDLL
ncbi:hypothetical protein ACFO4L_11435 [Bacillus daqingensis]|uniref:DUF3298 domain-containing protein n=1 Tax=Bacillus daqingensis TaxID=872396 RepID=A0ABV9NUY6_9BACI